MCWFPNLNTGAPSA